MKRLFLLLLLCVSSAFAQDLRPSAYLGLPGKITVRGGKILGTSGGVTTIAEQTLTPANSATTYVYIDLNGTPAVATSTSAFPTSNYFPICVVSKDANGVITTFTDSRPDSIMTTAGSIPTVTSNPATCSTGTTFFNTATSQFLLCVATNVLSTAAGSPATTIDAKLYGVLSDTRVLTSTTVSWTGATSTATVTATSSVFLPTDCAVGGSGCTGTVSKIAFGTNACCGGVAGDTGGTVTLPQGTIATYISGTQVTVSFSGTSTACNTTACIFVWGHDDTAALASAYTALLALGSDCGTLLLPAQKMLVQSALFITAPTCTGVSGTIGNTVGASETIEGFGMNSTMLIPTPNFDFATCTGTGSSCFLGWRFAVAKDWSIWGAGNSLSGGNHSKTVVGLGTESYADKFGIVAWGGSDTSLVGLTAGNVRVVNSIFRGAGQQGCAINAINTWFINTVCTYNQNIALAVQSGAILFSQNGFYGITNGAGSSVQLTGNYYGWGDVISGNGSGGTNTAVVVIGGNTYLNGANIACSLAAANALATNGGNAYATNSTFGGGSCNSVNRIANTYFDLGGNTYSTAAVGIAPTCAFTSGGGTSPSCALQAGSTNEKGTIIATTGTGSPGSTGTLTLTFAGTYAGATGATPSCTVSPNDSGTPWGNEAVAKISTQSTTAPVIAWSNDATAVLTALATSSPYRIDYTCVAR